MLITPAWILKGSSPTSFNNRKHNKGWVKIPIPKHLEDKEHETG